MAKEKVTLRIEKGELDLLKIKYNTDNQSEAIRLAINESLLNEDKEKAEITTGVLYKILLKINTLIKKQVKLKSERSLSADTRHQRVSERV